MQVFVDITDPSVRDFLIEVDTGFAALQRSALAACMPEGSSWQATSEVVGQYSFEVQSGLDGLAPEGKGLVVAFSNHAVLRADGYIVVKATLPAEGQVCQSYNQLAQVPAKGVRIVLGSETDQPTVALSTIDGGWLYVERLGSTTPGEVLARAAKIAAAAKEHEKSDNPLFDVSRRWTNVVVPLFRAKMVTPLTCPAGGLLVNGVQITAAAQVLYVGAETRPGKAKEAVPGALQHAGPLLIVRASKQHKPYWACTVRQSDWPIFS